MTTSFYSDAKSQKCPFSSSSSFSSTTTITSSTVLKNVRHEDTIVTVKINENMDETHLK